MRIVGANWRARHLVAYYLVALFTIASVLGPSLEMALSMIVFAEILAFFWPGTPTIGPASIPSRWRLPLRVVLWYDLISSCWSMAVIGVIGTGVFAIVFVDMGWHALRAGGLGPGSLVVAGVIAVWLLTRWLWAPPLGNWLRRSLQDYEKGRSQYAPWVSVGPDGIYVELRIKTIGGPQRRWVFHVTFDEIQEARTLGAPDAQAYWDSMCQYDPTLAVRAGLEMFSYLKGDMARPSIFQDLTVGRHLLVRSPTVLYLIGRADQTAPPAVAAWQEWRAAHEAPTGP